MISTALLLDLVISILQIFLNVQVSNDFLKITNKSISYKTEMPTRLPIPNLTYFYYPNFFLIFLEFIFGSIFNRRYKLCSLPTGFFAVLNKAISLTSIFLFKVLSFFFFPAKLTCPSSPSFSSFSPWNLLENWCPSIWWSDSNATD